MSDTGMPALVSALQGILNTEQMITNLTLLIPVVGGILIFAFTWRIVRRMISGAQKGKAKV